MSTGQLALLLVFFGAADARRPLATRTPNRLAMVNSRPGNVGMKGTFVPGESCTGERVCVFGATGYIGKAVVRESLRRGYPTTAVVREGSRGAADPKLKGATIVTADVTDPSTLSAPGGPLAPGAADVVISCLASRSGTKADSYAIDYQATLNCLEAAMNAGARHFVLLSAICVRSAERGDPGVLQFQLAKRDFEDRLKAQDKVTYSIVRPTAFMKSVSGQVRQMRASPPRRWRPLIGAPGRLAGGNDCQRRSIRLLPPRQRWTKRAMQSHRRV